MFGGHGYRDGGPSAAPKTGVASMHIDSARVPLAIVATAFLFVYASHVQAADAGRPALPVGDAEKSSGEGRDSTSPSIGAKTWDDLRSELTSLNCEFTLGRFEGGDKYILEYHRPEYKASEERGWLKQRWQERQTGRIELVRVQSDRYIVVKHEINLEEKAPLGFWHSTKRRPESYHIAPDGQFINGDPEKQYSE